MYGILLESLAAFIRDKWGEGKWESVRRHAQVDTVSFSTHHVYSETIMLRLAKSACQVLGVNEKLFFESLGVYFVKFVSDFGYDKILSVLGRQLRDFLNGLDNLHEYLKFSYPKMKAPSFYCDEETAHGLKLHYRTKRRGGLIFYVVGQIKQVAIQFYNQTCDINLLSEVLDGDTLHVTFSVEFDNSAFIEVMQSNELGYDFRTVEAHTLFELFPFCMVFNEEMEIKRTGHALTLILKDLKDQVLTEAFDLTRPLVPFCFNEIMQRRNNIFELLTVAPIHDLNFAQINSSDGSVDEAGEGLRLRLREWGNPPMMLYLANPVLPDIQSLMSTGLYINDLALHDCSRDMVLTGTQQSVELRLALDQEQQKSRKLVESMKKLDEEMKRTDELLYQMIPKQVADRLRNGENPVDTCQTFEQVSILFSDIIGFTTICSKITPMQVVSMLNHMYSLFDQLSERNGVYKVETIGDSYMVVSGAPVANIKNSERICDMAMEMVDACEAIEDPSELNTCLRIRIGCHSGMVAAGVVGIKTPRYCFFGDSVNIASRMESTSDPGKIQISEATKDLLPSIYQCEQRGNIFVKGKGNMNTFWLNGRTSRVPISKFYSSSIVWSVPTCSSKISGSRSSYSQNQSSKLNHNGSIDSFESTSSTHDVDDTNDANSKPTKPWQKLARSRDIIQKASSSSFSGLGFGRQNSSPATSLLGGAFEDNLHNNAPSIATVLGMGCLFKPNISKSDALNCNCGVNFMQNVEQVLKNPEIVQKYILPVVKESMQEFTMNNPLTPAVISTSTLMPFDDNRVTPCGDFNLTVPSGKIQSDSIGEFRNIVKSRNSSMNSGNGGRQSPARASNRRRNQRFTLSSCCSTKASTTSSTRRKSCNLL